MTIAIAARHIERSSLSSDRAARKAAYYAARNVPLTRMQIAGRLSMLDNGPVTIAAVRGLVVRVRTGALWITQYKDTGDHVLRAGESFSVDRAGPLVLQPLGGTELVIDWPARESERLSPGLEPIELAA